MLSAALGSDSLAAVPRSLLSGNWLEVRSPHVRLLTDAGSKFATRTVARIEAMHEVMRLIAPTLAIVDPTPRTVLLFADEGSFKVYRPLYGSRRENNVAAYFQQTPNDGFLILKAYDYAQFDPIALHEYTHAALHGAVPIVPAWLSEGLAEYFSSLQVQGRTANVGGVLPLSLSIVRGSEMFPLDTLIRVQRGSPVFHEIDLSARFYAQSWLLVHMLLSGQAGDLARFDRFIRAVRAGDDFVSRFQSEYGDASRVSEAFEHYARRVRYPLHEYTFTQAIGGDEASTPHRIANAEVLLAAGRMLMWQGDAQAGAAREHFEAALRLAPNSARAMAALGALEDQQGARVEADRRFGRATALDSTDTETACWIAESLWLRLHGQQSDSNEAEGRPSTAVLAQLRTVLDCGLRSDPHDLRLLELLARTYVYHPAADMSPGLAAISRAVRDAPERPDLVAQQIALLALNGDQDRARALRDGDFLPLASQYQREYTRWALEHSRSRKVTPPVEMATDEEGPSVEAIAPGSSGSFRLSLADSADILEIDAINRFNWAVHVNSLGDPVAALAVFDSLARSATEAKLRGAAVAAAAQLRGAQEHNKNEDHWQAAYNDGVALARRQDRAGALARFREVEQNSGDPKLRGHAHRAAVQIEDQQAIERAQILLNARELTEAESILRALLSHELTPERRKAVEAALQAISVVRARK